MIIETKEQIQASTEIMSLLADKRETIKLEKNSKGYNWEIKINISEGKDIEAIDRLSKVDLELSKRYGANNVI